MSAANMKRVIVSGPPWRDVRKPAVDGLASAVMGLVMKIGIHVIRQEAATAVAEHKVFEIRRA
jgi:hypothetical protein